MRLCSQDGPAAGTWGSRDPSGSQTRRRRRPGRDRPGSPGRQGCGRAPGPLLTIERSVRSVPRRRWHARLPVLARLGREQQTPTVPRRYDAHAAWHGSPSKHPEQQAPPRFQPPASRLTPPATLPSVPGRGERAAASGGRGELGAPAPAPRLTAGRIVSPSGRVLCVPCSRDTRVESRGRREQQAGRVSPARAQAAPLTA